MLNSSCFFSAVLTLVNKTTTVFLRRFGAFQQLVQPPEHFVICAHHSSFSFLPPNQIANAFGHASIAFIQLTAVL